MKSSLKESIYVRKEKNNTNGINREIVKTLITVFYLCGGTFDLPLLSYFKG